MSRRNADLPDPKDMNARERNDEITDLEEQLGALHQNADGRALSSSEQQRWDQKLERHKRLKRAEDAQKEEIERVANKPGHTELGSEPDAKGARDAPQVGPRGDGDEYQARRSLEQLVRSERAPEFAAERGEALITEGSRASRSLAARWAAATSEQAYESAFAKLLGDPHRGHMLWSENERAAYQRVNDVSSEMRAMSVGTDSSGGFMVPYTLDPSVMLSSDGSVNPLRQLSRVVQTTTNAWNGVTSAGVTAEWKPEGSEVSDASPSLTEPSIPVHFGDAFVPFSFEFGMDAADPLDELRRLLLDAADQLQATAFMNGTGSGQPTGLTTGLASSSTVATASADALAAEDVYTLQESLPSRFQPRAQWAANLTSINSIAGFETTNGAKQFPEVGNDPPRLLRKALNEASELDTAGATANAGNDNVLAYGDFESGFVIADRIGTSVEMVPQLFGTNQRPTGQRGLLMWFRTGSDVVVDNAIRLLTA